MIAQDLQELFDKIMVELLAIRTDITIMKYDLEQLQSKLDTANTVSDNVDPILDPNNPNVHRL